jgi:Periplasmic binding protein
MPNRVLSFIILLAALVSLPTAAWSEPGVTDREILLGSVLPLEGRAAGLGIGMRAGLDAALVGQQVGGRRVRILYMDDLYEAALTPLKVRKLIRKGIFAMVGNVGTPTAAVSLPMLKKAGIPAVGFFTGAGLLRTGQGPVLNYRASYIQETSAVIGSALKAGLRPDQVCAYVQNDAYGKAGLIGVQTALKAAQAPATVLQGLQALLAKGTPTQLVPQTGPGAPLNENGPVGVYIRNSREVLPGYESLKHWEKQTGYRCALVVTVGAYDNIARFVHEARSRGESWIISAVSFTGADDFSRELRHLGDTHNIIMSQVVPLLGSDLPIVTEARKALGSAFGFVSLEGYIVGRMTLRLLEEAPAPLTREGFVEGARKAHFDLGGLDIDFTHNGNQGSDLVVVSHLTDAGYQETGAKEWRSMVAWRPKAENDSSQDKPRGGHRK